MSKIFKSISAPLAIALVATPALAAGPVGRASPTVEDLKVEINQLTAEVEELKKGDSPFTVTIGAVFRDDWCDIILVREIGMGGSRSKLDCGACGSNA